VLTFLENNPTFRLTLNISGSLLEQFVTLNDTVAIDSLKRLLSRNQIELTISPFYHPLLPLISNNTLQRQLEQTRAFTKHILGVSPLSVLLPPELAVTPENIETLKHQFDFIIVDQTSVEHAWSFDNLPSSPIVSYNGSKLIVNAHAITELLRAYPTRINARKFVDLMAKNGTSDHLLVSVNDVELFGHHYVERIELLQQIADQPDVTIVPISQLIALVKTIPEIGEITSSSWNSDQYEEPFSQWDNPNNHLQQQYAQLAAYVEKQINLTKLEQLPDHHSNFITSRFDQGISSCHTYWLSNWPWWHPKLADKGARKLILALRAIPKHEEEKMIGEKMYSKLTLDIWQYHWQKMYTDGYKRFDDYREKCLSQFPDIS